ncbi:hypothetical protein BY996DRAFT_6464291 [Phakopsora pachyrhizi]|nr:hypothetical protein BY996DRAFT_6464291 [Phakopsora pachyrhizi]
MLYVNFGWLKLQTKHMDAKSHLTDNISTSLSISPLTWSLNHQTSNKSLKQSLLQSKVS